MSKCKTPTEAISYTIKRQVATITLNVPEKLNALTFDQWSCLAALMRDIAKREDVLVTVLTGRGRFFSAGADLGDMAQGIPSDPYDHYLHTFLPTNFDLARAFYTHPKIFVTALNGPAVGGAAALIAFSDFIYALPHVYILTPFASLGIVAELGASRSLVQRMGISKANEALLMGKRIGAQEMLDCHFVNKIMPASSAHGRSVAENFLSQVLQDVEENLTAGHGAGGSLLKIKELIRSKNEEKMMDLHNLAEVLAGLDGLVQGIPQRQMTEKLLGSKKSKL